MRPHLNLEKEALADLTTGELASVGAGATPSCPLFLWLRDLLEETTTMC